MKGTNTYIIVTFHSLEKPDFRIDSQNIKYSFKLKPVQGKL